MKLIENLTETESVFERLSREKKPIAIYGMGDGSAKIISVLAARGIRPSAVFASDEFVRGQSFLGYTVEKLSQVEERLADFSVVLGFSSRIKEVMDHIDEVAAHHPLYMPDVNIAGDYDEVFDVDYLRANEDKLEETINILADDDSRHFYLDLVNFKLSGKKQYLDCIDRLSYKGPLGEPRCYADLGAFTGDTVSEAADIYPTLETVIAFEPDPRSFRKLTALTDSLVSSGRLKKAVPVNAAAFDVSGVVTIGAGEGRGTSLTWGGLPEGLMKKKLREVRTLTLDEVVRGENLLPDLIKFDVEGCEKEALEGAKETVSSCRPNIIMSLYHRNRDIFELPLCMRKLLPDAKLYLRRARRCYPAWEVECIAII